MFKLIYSLGVVNVVTLETLPYCGSFIEIPKKKFGNSLKPTNR